MNGSIVKVAAAGAVLDPKPQLRDRTWSFGKKQRDVEIAQTPGVEHISLTEM